MMHNAHANAFEEAKDEDEDECHLHDGNQSNGTIDEPKRLKETELSRVDDINFVATRLLQNNDIMY